MVTSAPAKLHVPAHPARFVTAASLFDGDDAAINVMRRLLQSPGAEVGYSGTTAGSTPWCGPRSRRTSRAS